MHYLCVFFSLVELKKLKYIVNKKLRYARTLLKSTLLATGTESIVQPVLRRLGTGHRTG